MRALLVLGACAVLASPPVVATMPPAPATFIGVIRSDGALAPIAVFDGRDWWNAWPWASDGGGVKQLPVPASLDAIPSEWLPPGTRLPRDWTMLRASGASTRVQALRLVHATFDDLVETVAITTTLRPGPPGDALAIAGPGELGRFVHPGRTETARLLRQIARRIETLEADEIERWRRETQRSGREPASTLTRVYMINGPAGTRYVTQRPASEASDYRLTKAIDRIDGDTYYYLHGEKLFNVNPDDDCMMHLSTKGLVVVNRAGMVSSEKVSSQAFAEYCGDPQEWEALLGTVRIGSRMLWVMRVHLEDGFDYTLFDPVLGDPVELKGGWGTERQQ